MLTKKVLGISSLLVLFLVGSLILSCNNTDSEYGQESAEQNGDLAAGAEQIAKDRNLSPKDVEAALKTYIPSGKYDDYLMFSSGGHSGQVFVIGVPSRRLL